MVDGSAGGATSGMSYASKRAKMRSRVAWEKRVKTVESSNRIGKIVVRRRDSSGGRNEEDTWCTLTDEGKD